MLDSPQHNYRSIPAQSPPAHNTFPIGHLLSCPRPQVPLITTWSKGFLSPSKHNSTHPKVLHLNYHHILTRTKICHFKPTTYTRITNKYKARLVPKGYRQ